MKRFTTVRKVAAAYMVCSAFAIQPMMAQNTNSLKETDYSVPTWTVLQRALKQLQNASAPYSISTVINGNPSTRLGFAWFTNASVTDGAVQLVAKENATEADFANAKVIEAGSNMATLNYLNANNNKAVIEASGITADSKRNYTVHKAVAEGLIPGTTYSYRVGKDGAWSTIGSFTTAKNDQSPFSFIYITDTQANTDEMFNISQKTVHSAINAFPGSNFVLCNGDFVETPGASNSEWEWEQWFGTMQDVWLNYPLVPVQGNHDTSSNRNFFLHFNTDTTYNERKDVVKTNMNGTVYSFVYNNALIMAINYEDWSKDGYFESLTKWMREQVEAHKDVKWRIATYHKTMFTGSKSHQSDHDEALVREKMLPVFDELKIDLALQGHDHIYEVIGPVKNSEKTLLSDAVEHVEIVGNGNERENMTGKEGGIFNVNKGTLYFLNNSAGKKKYEPRTEQQMIDGYKDHLVNNYWGLFSGKFGQTGDPTFSQITVKTDTIGVQTYYVNAAGNNKLFDSFSVIKNNGTSDIVSANSAKVSIDVDKAHKTLEISGCNPKSIYLFNTTGILVKKTSGTSINISDLAKGVYLVKAIDINDEYSKKITVN